jgi:hypothetical protein
MEKHFVRFYSPGTFVAEQSELPIDSWDTEKAIELSYTIRERHGALPYGFQFITRSRTDDDLDSKVSATSNMYYLGGEILTLEDIKSRKDPKDSILILNMEGNGWDRVVVNTNSYKWTQPLNRGDVVLPYSKP